MTNHNKNTANTVLCDFIRFVDEVQAGEWKDWLDEQKELYLETHYPTGITKKFKSKINGKRNNKKRKSTN